MKYVKYNNKIDIIEERNFIYESLEQTKDLRKNTVALNQLQQWFHDL